MGRFDDALDALDRGLDLAAAPADTSAGYAPFGTESPEVCWRCTAARSASDVGLCDACLTSMRDPKTTAPEPDDEGALVWRGNDGHPVGRCRLCGERCEHGGCECTDECLRGFLSSTGRLGWPSHHARTSPGAEVRMFHFTVGIDPAMWSPAVAEERERAMARMRDAVQAFGRAQAAAIERAVAAFVLFGERLGDAWRDRVATVAEDSRVEDSPARRWSRGEITTNELLAHYGLGPVDDDPRH